MTPEEFWTRSCAASGVDTGSRHDAYRFGDSDAMADELLALVLTGVKRATAGLLDDVTADGEELPVVGGYSVLLDGSDAPRCVVRTTDVVVQPFHAVDAAFAADEGAGDRTLAWWRAGHRDYFTRSLAARGLGFSEDLPTVCERFELVWTG